MPSLPARRHVDPCGRPSRAPGTVRDLGARAARGPLGCGLSSEHPDGRCFDMVPEPRMEAVARRDINVNVELSFKEQLDVDEIQERDDACGIIFDKQIEVAVRSGFVPRRRSEQGECRRAAGANRLGMGAKLRDGVVAGHGIDHTTRCAVEEPDRPV